MCDAGASGPQPSLTAEALGHSQRGFSVYVCSCVLMCVCDTVFPSTRDFSRPKQQKIRCLRCKVLCVFICVCT